MYVRFVIEKKDEDSGYPQGLFQALSDLEYAGELLPYEEAVWRDAYKWFQKHLKVPSRLSWSPRANRKSTAICWFKDTSLEHIKRMYVLREILECHGISTRMFRSERPGYIVYEDDYQVAAVPFNNTRRAT